jgi:FlaG/FlaF family flagellin (archaellin)
MHLLRRDKKGLSVVVTTLIILVVSVLLATIVTFYAINVTTTRVQEESLHLTKQHVWFNTTGFWAQAAIVIVNTGGRDVVLDKISVRGQECPWTNVYYWRTNNVTISDDLKVTPTNITGLGFDIQIQGQTQTFRQADDDLTLKSGWTIVIYIMNPDSVSLNDVGIPVGITAFTSNAQYYKETNIEAAQ